MLKYLPACSVKILIAHCIYEGSLKMWTDELFFETWWKKEMLLYVYETPPHSVLMMCPLFSVLVLWMNYRVYRFPSSLIYLPDVVNTRFTQASNRIGHTALCSHTVNTGFFPPSSLPCQSVGFVCQAIMWSDLHLGNFLDNGHWVVMLSTVVCPSPPSVILLLMYVL